MTDTADATFDNPIVVTAPAAGVRLLSLHRPDQLNAMTHELVAALHAALDELRDDRSCRVAIITGAGRGFCAGLDLDDPGAVPGTEHLGEAQSRMATQQHIAALVPALRSLRQPVIAAVNGPAVGGGLALALACDLRIAATSARFGAAFVRIGLSGCDIGVSWLLPRLVGAGAAFELLLTGRTIDTRRALEIGLVNRVVAGDDLITEALALASEISTNSPFGVWMTKEVMWSQLEIGSLQAGIDLENRTQLLVATTEDMREALTAFRERRPPNYRDR